MARRTLEQPTAERMEERLGSPELISAANAELKSVISDAVKVDAPVIPLPPKDIIPLYGGLVKGDRVINSVRVRELTGEDEEALARADQSSYFHFIDRLLHCGVVQLGSEPESQTDQLLGKLLIGDREQILLGIREATYGKEIEVEKWICTNCGSRQDLIMEVEDIPIKKMSSPDESTFEVKLRKGGHAVVRLATGEDQLAIFDKQDWTQAQRETVYLSRCVVSIFDDEGEHSMQGFPSLSREMSMADRHSILKELSDRQPGPKYNDIKYTCENCGKEVIVVLGLNNLFPDIGWF